MVPQFAVQTIRHVFRTNRLNLVQGSASSKEGRSATNRFVYGHTSSNGNKSAATGSVGGPLDTNLGSVFQPLRVDRMIPHPPPKPRCDLFNLRKYFVLRGRLHGESHSVLESQERCRPLADLDQRRMISGKSTPRSRNRQILHHFVLESYLQLLEVCGSIRQDDEASPDKSHIPLK